MYFFPCSQSPTEGAGNFFWHGVTWHALLPLSDGIWFPILAQIGCLFFYSEIKTKI